jgi:hypothetical protein
MRQNRGMIVGNLEKIQAKPCNQRSKAMEINVNHQFESRRVLVLPG